MPPNKRDPRDHRSYRVARAKLRRESSTCHICGEQIDPALQYPHDRSWSAHHVEPLGKGGSVHGQIVAAHLDCNRNLGVNDQHVSDRIPASRVW